MGGLGGGLDEQDKYVLEINLEGMKRSSGEDHYCAFALNLIVEFQTFFTPKYCAKNKYSATSLYRVVCFILLCDHFCHEKAFSWQKRSDNKKVILYGEFTTFCLHNFSRLEM